MRKNLFGLEISIFILGLVTLFFEHIQGDQSALLTQIALYIYALVIVLILLAVILQLIKTEYKWYYLRKNSISIAIALLFILGYVLRLSMKSEAAGTAAEILPVVVILRSVVVFFELGSRIKQIDIFLQELFSHPARTIIISFLMVILFGSILLQLPVATVDGKGLAFINSLFTSTSAVCVTGLIVVDTATVFTFFGKLVILALIQIGGLSIIILSFFVIFMLRKRVSLESKLLISYVLSEDDVSSIGGSIKKIIFITILFEGAGALFLFFRFYGEFQLFGKSLLFAVFHAISAFCNAGFALFTNNLENYVSDPYVSIIVSILIISGGLSFAVFSNIFDNARDRIRNSRRDRRNFIRKLTMNTRVVLVVSCGLLLIGTFLFYALEHGGVLRSYSTGTQYLAAFFQSVTLRTAGFNTVPFGSLRITTLLVMMLFMFIGGASGSTAGGIKVNTFTAVLVWVKSAIKREPNITLYKNTIKKEIVFRGLLIILFGFTAVILSTIVMSLTEQAPLEEILFEAVSAFGTVGLSTGITGTLTIIGKVVIIVMMFIGRTGPLTILAAMNERKQKGRYEYPRGDILIG